MPTSNNAMQWRTLLLVLALSLSACASSSPPFRPQIPPPAPALMEPPPSPSFSDRAASDIRQWRQRLTDWLARSEACRTMPAKCA